MEHNRDKFFNQKGVSLVELLVVISIIVVISTLAIMSLGSSKNQLGRQTVARELKVAFERARFDSVKRRAQDSSVQAKVVVAGNSFTLKTDINQNGTLEAGEDRVNTSWNSSISIRGEDGSPIASPITVSFNKRGEITTTGGTAFLVCNGDCSTTRTVSNSNLVIVTTTGTVNILPGGTTVPTFAPPSVTTVPSNANIQSTVTIN